MDYFAEFCIWIKSLGVGQQVYMSFQYLSVAVVGVFYFWISKKMDLKPSKVMIAYVIDSIIIYSLMLFIGWAGTGFERFGARNFVTIFIWAPAIFYSVGKLVGIPGGKLCLMNAPGALLIHGLSRPGCMIVGCCKGYEASWGIYNVQTDSYRVPIQLIEMVLALVLFGVLFYILKRKKYKDIPWLYPCMLFVYGLIQFICDFYRDNEKLSYGISQRGFHAVSMIVVGAVWLFVIYRKYEKEKLRKMRFNNCKKYKKGNRK